MKPFAVLVAVLLLVACGGGGSGGSTNVPPAPGGTPSPTPGATPTPTPGATPTPGHTPTPTPGATPTPTALPSSAATITVDASSSGAAISPDVLGVSVATWFDITTPNVEAKIAQMGMHLVRFPGGSESDAYHWQGGGTLCAGQGYIYPSSTFDALMTNVAVPARTDVAVTLNYGSNAACNGGGDPSEAAAWVAYARSKGYNVKYWTVGNEVFGGWEYDLHSPAHDATTYANAVATGYYPQIKAADPNAQVGVVISDNQFPNWTSTVLKNASYDFVELHYYAQAPGNESDAYLLGQGVTDFANDLASVRSTMSANGVPATVPIYVGELNSVYANPGKQTVSIVNGLFAGMAGAEMMKAGIGLSTWWIATGGCNLGNNNSPALYGWQNFGTYNLFSEAATGYDSCAAGTPAGNVYPAGQAYTMLSQFAQSGSSMRNATVAGTASSLRAYADTRGAGFGLLLFNLDSANAQTVRVAVANSGRTGFSATQMTYGKAQYDQSQSGVWPNPAVVSIGPTGPTLSVTLPPWSMNLIELQ